MAGLSNTTNISPAADVHISCRYGTVKQYDPLTQLVIVLSILCRSAILLTVLCNNNYVY